ncbi:MAG TPA: hypothetical protein DIT98_02230 [Verrucomicrobiales bacterium]|nr:hypothetical protein [Verrucomicrobiales bacterium]|tara:strand:- start:505 stop:1014 length:510 start_codon:yes stop_codon:yes gene_type:complete
MQFSEKISPLAAAAILVTALAACSGEGPKTNSTVNEPLDTSDPMRPARNPYGTLSDFIENKKPENENIAYSNIYLWRASVSTLSFMGLKQLLPTQGTLVTEWTSAPASNEEIQFTVLITGPELLSENLNISGSKRIKASGTTSAVSQALTTNMKDAILLRARELRNASL